MASWNMNVLEAITAWTCGDTMISLPAEAAFILTSTGQDTNPDTIHISQMSPEEIHRRLFPPSVEFLQQEVRKSPDLIRRHQAILIALRDCAIAYYFNPFSEFQPDNCFEYSDWTTNLYAAVNPATRQALIAFRGTDSLIDWAVNLSLLPLPLNHPVAHSGFVIAWKLARCKLLPWLNARKWQFDHVVITGHSLGGALALVAAVDLDAAGFSILHCISVGAPRVYWRAAATQVSSRLGDRIDRILRLQDIVPTVPPEVLGFHHVGNEWNFIAELKGEVLPDPFPFLTRLFAHIPSIIQAGRIGDWYARMMNTTADQITDWTPMWFYLMLIIAGITGVAYEKVASIVSPLLVGMLFVALLGAGISLVVLGIRAHLASQYVHAKRFANVFEQWQLQRLTALAREQDAKPTPPDSGELYIDVQILLPAQLTEADKRRLTRAVVSFYGKEIFSIPWLRKTTVQNVFTNFSLNTPDRQFELACAALSLFHYSTDEIALIIRTGKIEGPRAWNRFYADSPQA